MRLPLMLVIIVALALAHPGYAAAADAGDGGIADGGSDVLDGSPDDGSVPNDASSDDASANDASVPDGSVAVACGGALCDTTNGAQCGVSAIGTGGSGAGALMFVLVILAGVFVRRRKHALGAILGMGVATAISLPARAEPPPPVDVVIHDAPPPRRYVTLQWNPISLFAIGKLSGDVVIAPVDHHALVVSPFYAWSNTAPIRVFDNNGGQTDLPEQKFRGFGAEIGYRYYFGLGGPRGFFLGPSLLIGSFDVTAGNGDKTSYLNYGIAGDVGYEALLADSLALTLGGGVQYTTTSRSIPDQQFPAQIYANKLVRPRVLAALGWAF